MSTRLTVILHARKKLPALVAIIKTKFQVFGKGEWFTLRVHKHAGHLRKLIAL